MVLRRCAQAVLALAVSVRADGVGTHLAEDAQQAAAFRGDDECMAPAGAAGDDGEDAPACAVNALQRRAAAQAQVQQASQVTAVEGEGSTVDRVWHYALPCYTQCGQQGGFCESYCGPGNACCKYMNSGDPPECHTVGFWSVRHMYTCVTPNILPDTNITAPDYSSFDTTQSGLRPMTIGDAPAPASLTFRNPLLYRPSEAPVMKFYVYRVQSDEDYPPENQNVGNIAGMLWYLHNEIVWHPGLKRSGTYFTTRKTRLEKFRVLVRPTQPLHAIGMSFAVVQAFDKTQCTGPYHCDSFKEFGYAVGCETWRRGSGSDFPHGQWDDENKYPNAMWYSLPGPCASKGLGAKTKECMEAEPGGACMLGGVPTGTGDCTYTYEKVGEISIDELEGIDDAEQFVKLGGHEYDKHTDHGHLTSFWDGKSDALACQRRVDAAEALFKERYPELEDLPDPKCDFNRFRFEAALVKAFR